MEKFFVLWNCLNTYEDRWASDGLISIRQMICSKERPLFSQFLGAIDIGLEFSFKVMQLEGNSQVFAVDVCSVLVTCH